MIRHFTNTIKNETPNASFVSVVELGVLFGSGRSLEMVRAEVPALSRAVPQDGNELNSMENLKR
jgi:hypothetical protein